MNVGSTAGSFAVSGGSQNILQNIKLYFRISVTIQNDKLAKLAACCLYIMTTMDKKMV